VPGLLALSLAACQADPAAGPAQTAQASGSGSSAAGAGKLQLKSGYTTTSASQASLWAAKDGGYFDAEGLDVSLTRITALAAMLAALQSTEIPLAFVSGQPPIEGDLQGGEFVIVAGYGDRMSGQLWTIPSITSAEQLKGKNLGTTALGSASHIQAQAGLAKLGVPKDQVGFVATGAPPQTLAVIQAGQIQGASFSPPESLQARAAGLHLLIDLGSLNIPTQQSAAISTRKYTREHPDVVERFVRATVKGTSRLIADREFAIKIIGAYAQIEDRDALNETVDYYSNLWTKDAFPSLTGIQQILDTTTVAGAKDAKPEQFVDTSFVEKIKSQGVT
jgi:NitT/TauT family transport system substrate-binding protein